MLNFFLIFIFFFSIKLHAQTDSENSDIKILQDKVRELEEVQKENSEILKIQLADQHLDQNSRGFIELKAGMSLFDPKSIQDFNKDLFSNSDFANWEHFETATIFDLEIGKTIYSYGFLKHEIGIGYQLLKSKADANVTTSGGDRINVYEKIMVHTMFARYAMLFEAKPNGKVYIGPGLTFGYSPISEFNIEVEEGNEGVHISAEGTSLLVEIFGKAKIEFSRYFSFVAVAGYRMQEAKNLRINAADIVSVRSTLDLDASGFFSTLGLAVTF